MMKAIIEKAREWALEEINKYNDGPPSLFNLNTSLEKGEWLAEKLDANKDIVLIGCYLMDIKLAECKDQGKAAEHIAESGKATEEFLKEFEIDQEIKNKILSCVLEHHGISKFSCIESEICANADCYRFINPVNVFEFVASLAKEGLNLSDNLNFVVKKLEEKHNILSLDICKEELEPCYKMFKELLSKARE